MYRGFDPARVFCGLGFQAKRGLAVERPVDSSTSNWGTGEPPIDEKATKRGVEPGTQAKGGTSSSESEGEVATPNLSRQKSTRDFINSKREERLKASEEVRIFLLFPRFCVFQDS